MPAFTDIDTNVLALTAPMTNRRGGQTMFVNATADSRKPVGRRDPCGPAGQRPGLDSTAAR